MILLDAVLDRGNHVCLRVEGGSVAVLPEYITTLSEGNAYRFSDWPNPEVPRFGAGVYTIWHRDARFIYVGMSGRGDNNSYTPSKLARPLHSTTQSLGRTPQRRPVLRLRG